MQTYLIINKINYSTIDTHIEGFNYILFSDRVGKVHKIGRFPLDSSMTSTYQLHLTLVENRNIKVITHTTW